MSAKILYFPTIARRMQVDNDRQMLLKQFGYAPGMLSWYADMNKVYTKDGSSNRTCDWTKEMET